MLKEELDSVKEKLVRARTTIMQNDQELVDTQSKVADLEDKLLATE